MSILYVYDKGFILPGGSAYRSATQAEIDAAVSEQVKQDAELGRTLRAHLDDAGAYEAEFNLSRSVTLDDNDELVSANISVVVTSDDITVRSGNGATVRETFIAARLLLGGAK